MNSAITCPFLICLKVSAIFFYVLWIEVVHAQQFDSAIERADELRKEGEFQEAFRFLDPTRLSREGQLSDADLALVMTDLGVTSMYQDRFTEALSFFQKGLRLREKTNDSLAIAESYNHIAAVYHTQSDFNLAASYYEKSLSIRSRVGDQKALGISYNNV